MHLTILHLSMLKVFNLSPQSHNLWARRGDKMPGSAQAELCSTVQENGEASAAFVPALTKECQMMAGVRFEKMQM